MRSLQSTLKRIQIVALNRAHAATLRGLGKVREYMHCPLCGWTGFQFTAGKPGPFFRFDARCPSCWSAERHRLAYVLLKDSLPAKIDKILHFAPEPEIQKWLQGSCTEYHTADLMDPRVMHKVDIQDMPFEDDTYDLIWCSHVLEHVPDDRRALSEIRRILAPNGIAVIQVPLWGFKTIEGDLPPSERLRVYYQEDHLRRYGQDILERLSMDGLSVSVRNVQELELQLVLRCSLNDMASNDVFLLRKLA